MVTCDKFFHRLLEVHTELLALSKQNNKTFSREAQKMDEQTDKVSYIEEAQWLSWYKSNRMSSMQLHLVIIKGITANIDK